MIDLYAELRDVFELGVEETPYYDPYEDHLHNDDIFPMLDEELEV